MKMKNSVLLGLVIISIIQLSCISKESYAIDNSQSRYTVNDLLRDYDNSKSFLELTHVASPLDSFIVYKVKGKDGDWIAEQYLFSSDSNLLTYEFYECCKNIGTAEFGIEIKSGALCSDSLIFLGHAYGVKADIYKGRPTWYFSYPNPVFLENIIFQKIIRPGKDIKFDTLKLTTLNSRPAYAAINLEDTLKLDFSSSFKLNGQELFIDSSSFSLPIFVRHY